MEKRPTKTKRELSPEAREALKRELWNLLLAPRPSKKETTK